MDFWICVLILAVITYVIFKAHKKRHYFEHYGIPQPPELPFLGVVGTNILLGRHFNDTMKDLYNVNKDAKYIGMHSFARPTIVLRDLELIKSVLVKNFDHFTDRKSFVDTESDPLFGKNVSVLNGDRWREVRNLLSPAFTSSKMRTMHGLMSHCAENFANQFIERCHDKEEINMKDVFTRYSCDAIATCAFGIEVDSLKEPENEFYLNGVKSTNFTTPSMLFKMCLSMACPALVRKLGIRAISKENTDFFLNIVETTIKTREERGINRPDMLQLLMDARETTKKLDIIEITAQAFVFFLAGFDTASAQACLIAHELAVNPEVQDKLQAEIDEVMKDCNGQPTYEAINNMAYLDAVFNETTRMHPIALLTRICTKEFELPPALPDSKPYAVKLGDEIQIPVSGIHSDPDYYEDPGRFDPERFFNKKTTNDVLNLGFGLGPRMCIASRFAILEIKVLFVYLLAKCSLVPCKKTCIPLMYSGRSFTPGPKGGFWLKAVPRN